LHEFIKNSNLVSANNEQNALKDLFTETIQEMLEAEMDTHLGYGKHEFRVKLTPNSLNGKSQKTVVSEQSRKSLSLETVYGSLSFLSLKSIHRTKRERRTN
jgi:transposase-like protein